jgi:hypothetical protein
MSPTSSTIGAQYSFQKVNMLLRNVLLFGGGATLGAAMACLVAFFLGRFTVFNSKVLGSVVSVVAGGVVTSFLNVGREYAWVGYCFGLAGLLLFFVFSGDLNVTLNDCPDPRIKLLDVLTERRRRDEVTEDDYKTLKESVLADLREHPAIIEPSTTRTRKRETGNPQQKRAHPPS